MLYLRVCALYLPICSIYVCDIVLSHLIVDLSNGYKRDLEKLEHKFENCMRTSTFHVL